jgi:2-polyprenyl-3-methyl-5-hydroxy-6-metoxy-1,4-benzoquinol methylase
LNDPALIEQFGIAAAIAAAARTGLLAELTRGPTSDAELARRLGLDLRATSLVLDALQTLEVVRREGDRVEPGRALLAAAKVPGGYELTLNMWAHTEEFLRTGEPFILMDRSPAEREKVYRNIVGGLAALFEEPARELAARLPLRPAKILDVGCGSGVWSLALAERHPGAHVYGLDLPAVLENFKARAAALSLTDRAHTIPADMHESEIPAGAYDLVIIANVLRLETPDRAARIVQRFAAGVAPGGALLVIDALAGGTPERERGRAFYALHLGLRTKTGQVHSPATISGWLAQAGLSKITAVDIADGAGGVGGLLATRD